MSTNENEQPPQFTAVNARELLARIERSREEQPGRLARARTQANEARERALATEPWDELCSAVPVHDPGGEMVGMMSLPTIYGKELVGARLAFDLAACCDDEDQVAHTLNKYLSMIKDRDHLVLVTFAALSVIAEHVIADMLALIEDKAADWDLRVSLAEAARNAWTASVSDAEALFRNATDEG
jgi:hypothetical protein